MTTEKQKSAARENIKKAQAASKKGGLSTAKRESLEGAAFAFPKERKEPLNDARHVRNAISRFGQVEGVSDAERDQAWKRIKAAAKKYTPTALFVPLIIFFEASILVLDRVLKR